MEISISLNPRRFRLSNCLPLMDRILLACIVVFSPLTLAPAWSQKSAIPEDLLFDEHVREEFGVNDFTAPSIERIFKDLENLGDLPYAEVSRKLPEHAPKERAISAISMGILIADGLLTVHCEKRGDLKPIGESLKAHAEALGADKRMNRHTKELVEHSLSGEWTALKKALAATQLDVEAELVLLRDVHMAHLISLGGWIRALQVACSALKQDFDEEKAKSTIRLDIIDYFINEMETIEVDKLSKSKVATLKSDLTALRKLMEPQAGTYTKDQISKINVHTATIITKILANPGVGK